MPGFPDTRNKAGHGENLPAGAEIVGRALCGARGMY